MIVTTAQIADWERFWSEFSTDGADRRAQHGCRGALVFRDASAPDRVVAVLDWDEQGWQHFLDDPTVPSALQAAGHLITPYTLIFQGAVEA